jgi:hypothetical protein
LPIASIKKQQAVIRISYSIQKSCDFLLLYNTI